MKVVEPERRFAPLLGLIMFAGMGADTAILTMVICATEPFEALTVIGYVPRGVDAAVAIVNVDVPVPANVAGLNAAVAFWGNPLAVSITVPLMLAADDSTTEYCDCPPGATVCDGGNALKGMYVGAAPKLAVTFWGPDIASVCGFVVPLKDPANPANG